MITIKTVVTKKDWKIFVDLPWKIYKNDPYWVAPLKLSVYEALDFQKNPFYKHASLKAFLAYDGDECVGRIASVVDDRHNEFHEEQTGFFGFFEVCDQNLEATKALFQAAEKWAISEGMKVLRGPMNPSTNHECGTLVEGFDDTPSIMMTYNPKEYDGLIKAMGYGKSKDLLAWEISSFQSEFSERLLAHSERLKKRREIKIRPINLKKFDQEVEKVLEIYNDAWEKNWGFVPMDREEFLFAAKDLKSIAHPELVLMMEIQGDPVAFSVALPDINQVLKYNRSGKLLPFGLLKLLWGLKGPFRKKYINRCRIITLGIKKEFRTKALGPLFYTEYFKRGPDNGYPIGEASWILEDNEAMNGALKHMGAKKTKTYRIYEKSISS